MQDNDERKGLPSGSNWHRYERCNGSYQLSLEAERLDQVAHKSSAEAASGERCHAAMVPEAVVELEPTEQTAVAFMKERSNDQVARIFGEEPIREIWEKRFWLTIGGKERASCRIDRLVVSKNTGLIQDYKFGFREPDPAEINAQLKFAVVLAALEYKHINNWIVQIVSGPYGVTEAHYDIKAIAHAYDEVVETLARINDEHAAFTPGVEQCRYCPAQLICQAHRDATVAPMTKLQITQLPSEPQRASKLLDEVEMLRRLCDEVETFYSDKLLHDPNFSIPNYAMVPGAIKREVTDWDIARSRLGEYLDVDQIKGAANYRLGDLEKALAKTLKLRSKEAKERINEILQGLIIEKQNLPSLKRRKDFSSTFLDANNGK